VTTEHSERHEELIQRVLVGELDEDDPVVRERLASCATCAADLAALRDVELRVREDAAEERAVFQAAESMPGAPGADRVEPILRARVESTASTETARSPMATPGSISPTSAPPSATGGAPGRVPGSDGTERREPARPPGAWGRLAWLAVAAAALLALLVWGPDGNGGAAETPLLLGDEDLRLLGPRGEVGALDDFRWEAGLPPGGWFELVVFDDTPAGDAAKVEHVRHLEESSWRAADDRERSFPAAIRWELRVLDATGSVISSGDARARRSSR